MAMTKGLTFAEAYNLQKSKEADASRARLRYTPSFSNTEQVSRLMKKVIGLLEEEDYFKKVKEIQKMLTNVLPSVKDLVTNWQDESNLDLVHHSIINNCPELLSFLFTETDFFPTNYQPAISPYAHLAAAIGVSDCLEVILIHRPDDFFKATLPKHAVKLPDATIRKLHLDDTKGKGMNKKSETILQGIRRLSEAAEMRISTGLGDKETDIMNLMKEMNSQEKSAHAERRRKRHKMSVSRDSSMLSISSGINRPDRRERADVTSPTQRGKIPAAELTQDLFLPRAKRRPLKKEKHSLTVYMDAFQDELPGVIGGAGVKVSVQQDIRPDYLPAITIKNNAAAAACAAVQQYSRRRRSLRGSLKASRSGTSHGISERRSSSVSTIHTKRERSRGQSMAQDTGPDFHKIQMGVRGSKKYKEFHLKIEHKSHLDDKDAKSRYMNKTPLTLAAEKGNMKCVQLILDLVILKKNPLMVTNEPLTLATAARSPETIMLLLTNKHSHSDYQGAVLTAIRKLFPGCLAALLSSPSKGKMNLFDGTNLYHILYSQSLIKDYRYEMMPEMTRVLISCREDVNAHKVSRTFPMYTLINCAFNITVAKQIYFYHECLQILLNAKANPHYDEIKMEGGESNSGMAVSRNGYTSAINCVLSNARNSINFFESSYWSKLFMKKMIITIEAHDRTPRRILNDVFFEYMDSASNLGVDRTILRTLLKYGGNPEWQRDDGKFPINVFFDSVLPYLTRFEMINCYGRYLSEMDSLMIMCSAMSQRNLKESLRIFLKEHLLSTPIQGLPVTKYFSCLMHGMLKAPMRLTDQVAQFLWKKLKRNKQLVRKLPVPDDVRALIMP